MCNATPGAKVGEPAPNPVKVYDAWNSWQASILAQELLNAGIAARVASTAIEFIAGRVPYQAATCPVWVDEQDVRRAQEVIGEFEQKLAESGEADIAGEPFCYHCGAEVSLRPPCCPTCGGTLDWSRD